jgi:hypothetical protein
MPRRHAARILMVATLLLMTLLIGFPAGRGLGAVSHAGQPTLGEVQQELDQCRSTLAYLQQTAPYLANLYRKAQAGKIVLVAVPGDNGVPAVVDTEAWGVLIAERVLAGGLSRADLKAALAAMAAKHAQTLRALGAVIDENKKAIPATAAQCAALERQRNQLLGGGTLFKLVPGLTKVVNTHSPELTIDPTAGTGNEKHCCDGGSWDVTYTWKVPDTVVPGTKYQVEVGIQVNKMKPEQPNGFQINVLAPDFAQAYNIEYPHPTGGTTTFDIAVASDQSGSKEYTITIGFVSSTVTYTYRP